MKGIKTRLEETIDEPQTGWAARFADRLKSWVAGVLGWGIELFFDVLGKAFAPKMKPIVDTLEATGKVPPELQPLLDEMKTPTGQIGAVLSQSAGSALVGGAIGKILDALLLPISYALNKATKNVMLTLDQYIAAWLRGKITDEYLKEAMYATGLIDSDHDILKDLAQVRLDPMSVITAWRRDSTKYEKLFQDLKDLGWTEDRIETLKFITQERLDPTSVITAWRRDRAKYEKLFQDLKDSGWTEDRIETLKFVTQYYPSPQDLITWQAREVFEPEMIARYGLDDEFEAIDKEPFYKAGMTDEQTLNYWRAHWEHASWTQVVEMLHRGQLTESEVWDWFRVIEIPPFWRQKLINVSWNVPTRVDVRRWWEMGTIDEARLREIYLALGYHDKDLDDYVIWTKIYVAFPDLIARFKNGWITEDDVRSELATLGMPSERIEEVMQTKVKPEKPAQVEEDRKATATEIMKGVKKELISWDEGIEMLGDLGYDAETAEFKLNVYLGVSEGSPETYSEFKQMTQLYRKAVGQEAKSLPPELIEANMALAQAKAEFDRVKGEGMKEEKLVPYQKAVDDAAYRYRQLLIKWKETKQ